MESRYEVDSIFIIGKSHAVCQDYSLSGKDPFPYVIISDGCSSSPHTDVGARIIAHMAKYFLMKEHIESLKREVIISSQFIIDTMKINQESLDCTLGTIYIVENNLYTRLFGDGIVIYKYDNCRGYIHVSYDKNAPYYPSYLLNSRRCNEYEKMDIKVHHHQVYYTFCKDLYENEKLTKDFTNDYTGEVALEEVFPLEGLEYILIASDGLASFTPEIPLEEVVELFTSFKSTKGEFIKRRTKKALKELAERGIYNSDDISIGGILVNDKK